MSKITAKNPDVTITVEEIDGEITVLFDGKKDTLQREVLDLRVKYAPPMGGTFYPEPGTMLAYYSVFESTGMDISVEGDIGEIPCDEGDVIY